MTDLRVACLGAGYFAQFHIDAWKRMDRAVLIGIADLNIGRSAVEDVRAYLNLGAMLAVEVPDILDVILPPTEHADAIRLAIKAGVQTIICQKPFATSLDEARALTREAEVADIRLIIHENFRFQPWYRAAKERVERGVLGHVLQADFRFRPGDGQGPNAYLDRQPYFQTMERFLVHETAIHWIDVFRFLFGEPTDVYADLRRCNPAIQGEDAGTILMTHETGVTSCFDGNRLLSHQTQNPRLTFGEALIEGTKATLKLSGDGQLTIREHGQMDESVVLSAQEWPGFSGDCVFEMQAHVVGAILDGAPLENSACDYLKNLQIEALIYASSETGQRLPVM